MDIYIQYIRGDNLLGPADTLQHEDVCVDVLHLQPAGNTERRIGPHPVHQGSQLQQERHCQETSSTYHSHVQQNGHETKASIPTAVMK